MGLRYLVSAGHDCGGGSVWMLGWTRVVNKRQRVEESCRAVVGGGEYLA